MNLSFSTFSLTFFSERPDLHRSLPSALQTCTGRRWRHVSSCDTEPFCSFFWPSEAICTVSGGEDSGCHEDAIGFSCQKKPPLGRVFKGNRWRQSVVSPHNRSWISAPFPTPWTFSKRPLSWRPRPGRSHQRTAYRCPARKPGECWQPVSSWTYETLMRNKGSERIWVETREEQRGVRRCCAALRWYMEICGHVNYDSEDSFGA